MLFRSTETGRDLLQVPAGFLHSAVLSRAQTDLLLFAKTGLEELAWNCLEGRMCL